MALLLIAAVAVVRLVFPGGPFCAVRWPSPINALCSR